MDFKHICSILLCVISISLCAQTYTGFTTDNYSGLHSLLLNPANISDSRNEFDLNLISINANFTNDYASANLLEAFGEYDFNEDGEITPTETNNVQFHSDILGPSLMFNISPRSAIGLLTRARFFGNTNNFNGNLFQLFDTGLSSDTSASVTNNNFNSTTHAWTEIGIAYGAVVTDKKKHFVKVGVTAKLLSGRGFVTVKTDNFDVEYDAVNENINGAGTGVYSFSGNLDKNQNGRALDGISRNVRNALDDYDFNSGARGIGFDFGLVYEWRPNEKEYHFTNIDGERAPMLNKNKYKVKVGLSITDIGSITYKDALSNFYLFDDLTLDKQTIQGKKFNSEINEELAPEINSVNKKIALPTAIHLNADWNIRKNIYLNLNSNLSLISADQKDANRITNMFTLTPRYEKRWLGFYVPVSYQKNAGVLIGTGIRLGPVFAGSSTVISNLVTKNSNTAHFYAGINIPIYFKQPKDTDEDGIPDELDECPNLPGSVENKGCPGEKSDMLNPEDDKPDEVKILDSDGDGIADELDECPYQKGDELNNGCPEKEEFEYGNETADNIETSFKKYSKAVNFFYDKTEIQNSAFSSLKGMLGVMQQYPNARFIIEGHTDAKGPESYNQRLSKNRAVAVKKYFVQNGIDPERLDSVGYGETRPISTNATSMGRSKNRRVEIILIK